MLDNSVVIMMPVQYLLFSGALMPFILAGALYIFSVAGAFKYLPKRLAYKYSTAILVLTGVVPAVFLLYVYPKFF